MDRVRKQRVTAPNGVILEVPASIASGLVGDGNRGYAYVADQPPADEKPEPTKSTRKPRKRTG